MRTVMAASAKEAHTVALKMCNAGAPGVATTFSGVPEIFPLQMVYGPTYYGSLNPIQPTALC